MVTEEEIEIMIEKFKVRKHNANVNDDKSEVYKCELVLNSLYWALGRTTTIFI